MNCQDVAKLRTPLDAVCQTTDIGCVPIVSGKPTCKPQPDELPIAYDKTTSTLWLFSCDTREWLAFGKFSICQLSALNLDNIRNICDVLNIAVNYGGSGECVQGTITLKELADRILECIELETKIITIGQGDGNKVKITIEGLPLDPVYVQGKNIWSEGGSGTETDPLIIATYDPICKWPTKTQTEVDAADVKHLGACVDGEAVRIPYIKPSPPVCEADQITLEQASAAGSSLTLVGCDDRTVVRIPVSGSGFFDRDYICVPTVISPPQGAPAPGTGPLRVGCNGELYVWLCEEARWEEVRFNPNGFSSLTPSNVDDICNNFRMLGWYSNTSGDPCVQQVKFTLKQLARMIEDCSSQNQHVKYVSPTHAGGGICFVITIDNGVPTGHGNDMIYGYSLRDGRFIYGNGSSPDYPTPPKAHITLNITNPWPDDALLEVNGVVAAFTGHRYTTSDEYQTTVYADFTENFNSSPPWTSSVVNNDDSSVIIQPTPVAVEIQTSVSDLYTPGKATGPTYRKILRGNESVTVYGFLWFLGVCVPPSVVVMHAMMHAGYILHRYA